MPHHGASIIVWLKLYRRGHYRGSLPRHPPPVPRVRVSLCIIKSNVSDNGFLKAKKMSCFLCEGPCDITFQPCGHTAMCAECAEPVKRCTTCKVSCVGLEHAT